MYRRDREEHKTEKLNLVPIMDAVFIFIFFLLFSAQFIKLYEIETEAPIVSDAPTIDQKKEDPLHLTVKVRTTDVRILTGLDSKVIKTFYTRDPRYLETLNSYLLRLRMQHPDDSDDYAIVAPEAGVDYEQIVKVIESVQRLPAAGEFKVTKTNGKEKILNKIYSQVVLEPLDET